MIERSTDREGETLSAPSPRYSKTAIGNNLTFTAYVSSGVVEVPGKIVQGRYLLLALGGSTCAIREGRGRSAAVAA